MQGWYPCDSGHSELTRLCMDQVSTLGVTGTYGIYFLDGRALQAQFAAMPFFLPGMLQELSEWRGGDMTLVSFKTANTEIDIIKANHDLGSVKAMEQFGRYLVDPGVRHLVSVRAVPRTPPSESEFASTKEYLDSLPQGGVLITLTKTETNVLLDITPLKQDLVALFPAYCADETCELWCMPPSDLPTSLGYTMTLKEFLDQRAQQMNDTADNKNCQ